MIVINETYDPTSLAVQGGSREKELDTFTRELNKQYCKKFNDTEAIIKYYYKDNFKYITFLVYTDLYSGMVKGIYKLNASEWFEDILDNSHIDTILKNIKKVNADDSTIIKSIKETKCEDYGGAYDIDSEMYFTKDDIVEFANNIIDTLYENTSFDYDLADVYIDKNGNNIDLNLEILVNNEFSITSAVRIDMRRIRKPSDLSKYNNQVYADLIDQLNYYDE